MQSVPSPPLSPPRRARFEALRSSVFAEMSRSSARMRLLWVMPFYGIVLWVLVVRGFPRDHALLFGAAVVATLVLFLYQAQRRAHKMSVPSILIGIGSYGLVLVATGGLASPLVPMGMPIVVAGAVLINNPRAKLLFLGMMIALFLGLALLSQTERFGIVAPLAPEGGHASAEFILVIAASLVFTTVMLARHGRFINGAYERIAFELVARREELCNEGEGRTRALEGIAARLAHEVKNPLAAIKGLSTHMARNSTDPKTAERLSIVAAEADRLQAIVDGFLSFSRGLDELQPVPTKPFELARELTLLLETRAADAGITLEVTGDPSATLEADARKLRQALLNLVLNAMQASPRGQRVTVDVGSTCPMSHLTTIKVIDHGAGMTDEVLDRIRKPYFTTREGGSGLGVAVARGLVEQHGGSLEYESAPGRGTTVILRLPKCVTASEMPLPKVACAAAAARAISQRKEILRAGMASLAGEQDGESAAEAPVVAKG